MNLSQIYAKTKNKLIYLLKLEQRLQHWDDARYLKLLYRLRMGERLNLDNPQKFSQKLQWLKLHDRDPIYTTMVDKGNVKQWVADKIGQDYVVPNLGVWDSFAQIDFNKLPDQFVLKCTHDSGGLVICEDRSTLDIEAARAKIERSMARNYYFLGREWPYRNVKPRILAEVYVPTWDPREDTGEVTSLIGVEVDPGEEENLRASGHDLIDYKFYCFHGEPKFLYVSQGLHDHRSARMDFLTLDWTLTEFGRPDYLHFEVLPPKPTNFEAMKLVARELASGIPFVRVDLFEHSGRILFSEMTFSPVSGMMSFKPRLADLEIGQLLNIPLTESAG